MANIFVFAFDLSEASQIRRIRSLQKLGHEVRTAAFNRKNMNSDFVPAWPNIELGVGHNEQYGKRLLGLIRGLWRVQRAGGDLKMAEVIIARNFDLLVLAWIARLLANRRTVPIVYECLDIHRLFTRPGAIGVIMRWAERRLLGRIQLLIVSSPGFVASYFKRVQGYGGPVQILENKLWFDDAPILRPSNPACAQNVATLSLGWVGSIRCAPSLKILMRVADQLGEKIVINIYGNVHRHVLPDFDDAVLARQNVRYHGPYVYPTDLEEVYRDCDLVWAQDLWQREGNSDWLLPNRIYEASWFGCPCIAVEDTQTGRKISEDCLGFTIDHSTADALSELLLSLSRKDISEASSRILAMDAGNFVLSENEVANALDQVLPK